MNTDQDKSLVKYLISLSMEKTYYEAQFQTGEIPTDFVEHYLNVGWKDGLDPCAWFSTSKYLNANPSVMEAGINPLAHYLLHLGDGSQPIAPDNTGSGKSPIYQIQNTAADLFADIRDEDSFDRLTVRPEFDEAYYLAQFAEDIRQEIQDPLGHFLEDGWREGYNPNDWFSVNTYLSLHKDVVEADMNPFLHYLFSGRAEGRGIEASLVDAHTEEAAAYSYIRSIVEKEFNREFYLSVYPDIAIAGVDPVDHYLQSGWREGRDPSVFFSTKGYFENNPDVEQAGINPLYHYLIAGRSEDRRVHHDRGFRYDIINSLSTVGEQVAAAYKYAPVVTLEPKSELLSTFKAISVAGRPLAVSFSHDNFMANIGGVQLCIRREVARLGRDGWAHIHFFPAVAMPVIEDNIEYPVLGMLVDGKQIGYFRSDEIIEAAIAAGVNLNGHKKIFIVHSFLGHNLRSSARILNGLGIAEGYFWIHDYASVCSNYRLMRNNVEFCGAPAPSSSACRICEYGASRLKQAAEFSLFFQSFNTHIVSPSEAALLVWQRNPLFEPSSVAVVPHAELEFRSSKNLPKEKKQRPLRVGYLGFPMSHKGWPVFKDLVMRFSNDDRYEFFHLGKGQMVGLPATYVEVLADDNKLNAMTEAVSRVELDVALVWSLCPETFCLVAFEALAGGAVIVTNPDSGNVASIVQQREDGRIIATEAALYEAFESGELRSMSRTSRPVVGYDLNFGNLTADFMVGE